MGWTEGDLEGSLYVDGGALFRSGLEFPLCQRIAGEAVESVINTTQDAYAPYCPIRMDHCIQDHRTVDVFTHELHWIRRVDFAGGHWLGDVGGRRTWILSLDAGRVIQFRKANDPTSATGIQVRHVERHRVEVAVAEDGAFGFAEFCGRVWLHGTRCSHAWWMNAGDEIGIDCIRRRLSCGLTRDWG